MRHTAAGLATQRGGPCALMRAGLSPATAHLQHQTQPAPGASGSDCRRPAVASHPRLRAQCRAAPRRGIAGSHRPLALRVPESERKPAAPEPRVEGLSCLCAGSTTIARADFLSQSPPSVSGSASSSPPGPSACAVRRPPSPLTHRSAKIASKTDAPPPPLHPDTDPPVRSKPSCFGERCSVRLFFR